MRNLTRFTFALTVAMMFFVTQAQAFTFRLSQQDLNQVVRMTFPQTQYYQDMKVVISDPSLFLQANNNVAVEVNLLGTQGGQKMEAAEVRLHAKFLKVKPSVVKLKSLFTFSCW